MATEPSLNGTDPGPAQYTPRGNSAVVLRNLLGEIKTTFQEVALVQSARKLRMPNSPGLLRKLSVLFQI